MRSAVLRGCKKSLMRYLLLLTALTATIFIYSQRQTNRLPNLSKEYSLHDPIVNPYNFSFVLNSENCSQDVQLLIVVHSSTKPTYAARRKLMRNTWLTTTNIQQHLGFKSKIVFFIGSTANQTIQRTILEERHLYKDIVQSDFVDSYTNNTYKAMSFLLWTALYCENAQLLLKLDDDVLLHTKAAPPLRANMLRWMKSNSSIYIGKETYITYPVRNPWNVWYVSRERWPYDSYPLWFQGMVYFLSPRKAAELFQAALRTQYMHTDDVFIGILVNKTSKPGQQSKIDSEISASIDPGWEDALCQTWIEGRTPFFHMPDKRLYASWFYWELNGFVCEPHMKFEFKVVLALFLVAIYSIFIIMCCARCRRKMCLSCIS